MKEWMNEWETDRQTGVSLLSSGGVSERVSELVIYTYRREWTRRRDCDRESWPSCCRSLCCRATSCGMYCLLRFASRRIRWSWTGRKSGIGGTSWRLWWWRRGRMPGCRPSWQSSSPCSRRCLGGSVCGQWSDSWSKRPIDMSSSNGTTCSWRICSCRNQCSLLPKGSDGPSLGCIDCTESNGGICRVWPCSTTSRCGHLHSACVQLMVAFA